MATPPPNPKPPNVAAAPPDPLTPAERKRFAGYEAMIRNMGAGSIGDAQKEADYLALQKKQAAAVAAIPPDPTPAGPLPPDPTAVAVQSPPPVGKVEPLPDVFDSYARGSQNTPKPPGQQSATTVNRDNDLLDEALGEPPDPLRDYGGPNDPAAGQRLTSGGKPVDVNIVGSIPLPVFMTQGGAATLGGPGGRADDGQAPHRNAYGVSEQGDTSAPLAGQTVQEGFSKFAGGYAAGYPIHNLAQLGKNLTRIGRGGFAALNQMTGGALGTGLGGIGKMVAGSRLGKAAGRGLGRITAALEKKKYGVGGAAKLFRGRAPGAGGAAQAAAAGGRAAGMAAGVGGAAAAVAAPVGAVVAFGSALAAASQEVYSFARAQEEEIRRISEYNAALALATAELDLGRLERDIAMGEATAESGTYLTESMNQLEQMLAPIQELMTNVANVVGGALLEVVTGMAVPLNVMSKAVTDFIHWWRGTRAEEPHAAAWDVFREMSDALDREGRRMWPGAGPGAGGPGWGP